MILVASARYSPNTMWSVFFLVTGKNSFTQSGAEKKFAIMTKDYEVVRFSDFEKNPKKENIERGMQLYQKHTCDTVIAVGGGSVIDTAKIIRAAGHTNSVDDLIDKKAKYDNSYPLFIVAPTTAGSGSEATQFAVVYREKIKYSVAHESLIPDIAIVDPSLTLSMNKNLTASTGLDALSQAIESYWAIGATNESQEYARKALKFIIPNIDSAIHNPTHQSRTYMAHGAYFAGKAINITRTTAPHAFSYVFTSHFNIPHGHAVALTLGSFIEFNEQVTNEDTNDPRGANHTKQAIKEILDMLGCDSAHQAREKIEAIMSRANLATRLTDIGVTEKDIKMCAQSVNNERLNNSPRTMNENSITTLYRNIL